ncbi:hypothetical protein HKX48_006153 [Thoreauomyces humboldtii]|nr:hypothetical protein HKX48_006153 [Thoreauomyces humboldtii]
MSGRDALPLWKLHQEQREQERRDRERQERQDQELDRERQDQERQEQGRWGRARRDREPRASREPEDRVQRIQEEADREAQRIQEEEGLEETVRLANVAIALAPEFPLPGDVHPELAAQAEEAQVLARKRAKEAICEEQLDLDRRLKLLSGNLKKYSSSTDRLVIDNWRDNHRCYLITLGYDAITKGASALTHLESSLEGSARN